MPDRSFLIGRANDCDFIIESGFISRHHCKITAETDGYFLVDLGSSLGTCLNGREIKRALLGEGDLIRLAGRWEAVFAGDAQVAFTETMEVVQGKEADVCRRLVTLSEIPAERDFPLDGQPKAVIRIGRNPDNDICLPLETVSGFHAELVRDGSGWVLTDLDSSNGTFVNEERIQRQTLQKGDLVSFDRTRFRFEEGPHVEGKSGTRIRGRVAPPPGEDKPWQPEVDVSLARPDYIPGPTRGHGPKYSKLRLIWGLALLLLLLLGMAVVTYALWSQGYLSLSSRHTEVDVGALMAFGGNLTDSGGFVGRWKAESAVSQGGMQKVCNRSIFPFDGPLVCDSSWVTAPGCEVDSRGGGPMARVPRLSRGETAGLG